MNTSTLVVACLVSLGLTACVADDADVDSPCPATAGERGAAEFCSSDDTSPAHLSAGYGEEVLVLTRYHDHMQFASVASSDPSIATVSPVECQPVGGWCPDSFEVDARRAGSVAVTIYDAWGNRIDTLDIFVGNP